MSAQGNYILEIDSVLKAYGEKKAVDHLSLLVPEGSIFGLLGPNGAGKTSLIRMITTITRPDAGKIKLAGEPLGSHHPKIIGYLPEERGLYKKMKVGEHLLYLGQLKGLSYQDAETSARSWLEKLGLIDRWDQLVEALSKGLQQQVQFVATVLHRPRLLILDEPFSGLDPVNTNRLKQEIRTLHDEGVSIIFSTHRMEQVEEICEYIALINDGQNVLEGSVHDIQDQFKPHQYAVGYHNALPAQFDELFKVVEHRKREAVIAWPDDRPSNELVEMLLRQGIKLRSFHEILPSLNDIFIQVVEQQTQ